MSIPLPILASNQITLVEVEDATDAYSVFLTSESYTFIGNTTGAPSGLSCTTQALAYYGAQQCSKVNISTVTCPTGISAAITDNNTVSPTITFSTTDTITQACEATIPVVVDGVIINKKFSFAVAKQGGTGLDGKGIKSTTITYQTASSGAIAPTGAWSETIPSTDPSKPYLWTRTAVTYTDDTTSTSYSVSSTLEGVSVGGRNLILDTKTMRKWTKGSKLTVTYSVADERGGTDAVKIVNSEGTVGEAYFNHPLPSSVSLESSTYTLSFWSKSDASTGSAIQINSDGFTNAKTISINDIWKRYVYSFTTSSVYTGTEVLWFNILGASPVYLAHVKLELGNIATDWTPAPEDQESDVTSKIEQLKDSITLEITGPDGVKSSIAMDDDGKIALTGDVIAQRINVDELMAQHLTSTGGLDVTGDFLVKNTYGSITQGTTASGYGFTQIDNTETIDDCEYSSSIISDNGQVNLSHRYTSSDGSADTSYVSISDILKIGSAGHIEMNSKDYIFMQSENGMTLSADNIDVWGNLSLTGTITGPTRTITVNGDLNTYYPVHIKTDCSKNDREYHLYIGKKLWTTSPAWEGNHSSGSSSLTIGWAYRANGWDGCGYYNKTLYKYEPYAALISNVQFMNGSTTGVVVWLRGGGATYNIHSDTPFTATVYLDTTNIGTSDYPINVEPYTTIYNAGWCSAHTLYDYGSWTPTIADATVSSYTKQQGWYLKIGNVVTVGWYLYAKFASNQTSNKYVIQGLPYTPAAVGTGGGLCSGYYSANQVNFSGWYAHPNGRIYGYGVTNGAAGNKWAEEKIFCGTGDSYSTGTIIYTTTT